MTPSKVQNWISGKSCSMQFLVPRVRHERFFSCEIGRGRDICEREKTEKRRIKLIRDEEWNVEGGWGCMCESEGGGRGRERMSVRKREGMREWKNFQYWRHKRNLIYVSRKILLKTNSDKTKPSSAWKWRTLKIQSQFFSKQKIRLSLEMSSRTCLLLTPTNPSASRWQELGSTRELSP